MGRGKAREGRRRRSLRISSHGRRPGIAAGDRTLRLLGSALDRIESLARQSRCAAFDVGHAAQPRPEADAAEALDDPVPVYGRAFGPADVVVGRSAGQRHRLVLAQPRLRHRPLCIERPQNDDGDLDGYGNRAPCRQRRQHEARRRQAARVEHANVAGFEPVRERKTHNAWWLEARAKRLKLQGTLSPRRTGHASSWRRSTRSTERSA